MRHHINIIAGVLWLNDYYDQNHARWLDAFYFDGAQVCIEVLNAALASETLKEYIPRRNFAYISEIQAKICINKVIRVFDINEYPPDISLKEFIAEEFIYGLPELSKIKPLIFLISDAPLQAYGKFSPIVLAYI